MNIKYLREKINLSQKAFGKRLGLSAQSILNYESGKNIPESVQKLIRYEFAEYLPEEERIASELGEKKTSIAGNEVYSQLREENQALKQQVLLAKEHEEYIKLQRRTIELLEDQIKLYKDRLSLEDKSKTA